MLTASVPTPLCCTFAHFTLFMHRKHNNIDSHVCCTVRSRCSTAVLYYCVVITTFLTTMINIKINTVDIFHNYKVENIYNQVLRYIL